MNYELAPHSRNSQLQSLPAASFLTSSNWVISTVPSGNLAVILSSPPMAFTKSWSVLTYISARRSSLDTAAWLTLRIFGEMHLCSIARLAEFVESHAGAIAGRQTTGTFLSCGGHPCAERIEVLGHRLSCWGSADPDVLLIVVAYLFRFRSSCLRC